jgi:hypothetical protein
LMKPTPFMMRRKATTAWTCCSLCAMKRGPRDDELTPPPSGGNMLSVVRRIAGVGLGTPVQFEDQTAALHLGHFAMSSVLGSHVTRMLDGTGTEADPGISSLHMSNAVRNAAAACQARKLRSHVIAALDPAGSAAGKRAPSNPNEKRLGGPNLTNTELGPGGAAASAAQGLRNDCTTCTPITHNQNYQSAQLHLIQNQVAGVRFSFLPMPKRPGGAAGSGMEHCLPSSMSSWAWVIGRGTVHSNPDINKWPNPTSRHFQSSTKNQEERRGLTLRDQMQQPNKTNQIASPSDAISEQQATPSARSFDWHVASTRRAYAAWSALGAWRRPWRCVFLPSCSDRLWVWVWVWVLRLLGSWVLSSELSSHWAAPGFRVLGFEAMR